VFICRGVSSLGRANLFADAFSRSPVSPDALALPWGHRAEVMLTSVEERASKLLQLYKGFCIHSLDVWDLVVDALKLSAMVLSVSLSPGL
jgi:hypothetical protein